MKRRPAYARELAATLAAGLEPLHGIAVYLDRTPPQRPLLARLACFADTDPAALDWSLCRGRDVVVPFADQADPDRLGRLLDALKAARPRRLQAWSASGDDIRFIVTADGRAATC